MTASKVFTVEGSGSAAPIRQGWLDRHQEEILEPDLPIVDAHHHLWDRASGAYMLDEFYADAASGHRIVASVYVEARSMYRQDGREELRSVGEVEFANGMAAIGASGLYGPCRVAAGIVGMADLRHPMAQEILRQLAAAGSSRFRGIRQVAAYDADPGVSARYATLPKALLLDEDFRLGFRHLGSLGLSFDAYVLHPQLSEVRDLAERFPDTPIVLDHLGTPLGVASYAGRRDEIFQSWRVDMQALARCPNVSVKLSGLGMSLFGFGFHQQPEPPSSEQLQSAWQAYILTAIELFGVERCMFASNFPPDKGSCAYPVLWNGFKRIVADFSSAEKASLFHDTAKGFYRL